MGIRSHSNGKKKDQTELRTCPIVTPTLKMRDSLANPLAHLFFGSVSITSRSSGVAEANETNDTAEYITIVPETEPIKRNENRKTVVST